MVLLAIRGGTVQGTQQVWFEPIAASGKHRTKAREPSFGAIRYRASVWMLITRRAAQIWVVCDFCSLFAGPFGFSARPFAGAACQQPSNLHDTSATLSACGSSGSR